MEHPPTTSEQRSGRHPVRTALLVSSLFLLTLSVVWLYCEVGRIPFPPKDWNVSKLETRVDDVEQRLDAHSARLSANEGDIAALGASLASTNSDLISLASFVDRVAAVANNADMYSHSHYSDLRLKEDVVTLPHALEKMLLLRGVSFKWNASAPPHLQAAEGTQLGLIAQEVERVFPELVSIGPDGYKTVDYVLLTPVLIEAIKQQQAQLGALQRENQELESRLSALEEAAVGSVR